MAIGDVCHQGEKIDKCICLSRVETTKLSHTGSYRLMASLIKNWYFTNNRGGNTLKFVVIEWAKSEVSLM